MFQQNHFVPHCVIAHMKHVILNLMAANVRRVVEVTSVPVTLLIENVTQKFVEIAEQSARIRAFKKMKKKYFFWHFFVEKL